MKQQNRPHNLQTLCSRHHLKEFHLTLDAFNEVSWKDAAVLLMNSCFSWFIAFLDKEEPTVNWFVLIWIFCNKKLVIARVLADIYRLLSRVRNRAPVAFNNKNIYSNQMVYIIFVFAFPVNVKKTLLKHFESLTFIIFCLSLHRALANIINYTKGDVHNFKK